MSHQGRRAQREQLERTHKRITPPKDPHSLGGWMASAPRGPVMFTPLGGQFMRVDRPSEYRSAIVSRKINAIKKALAEIEAAGAPAS